MSVRTLPLALAVLFAALAGCDRTPIASVETELLLSDPDLSVVQLDPELTVRLAPNGRGGALLLEIRNKEIPFDSLQGAFIYERTLDRGLNVFPYAVTDEIGTVFRDTFYAVHFDAASELLVNADDDIARRGAAAIPIEFGALVTGGIGPSGDPLASWSRIGLSGAQVLSSESSLLVGRAFHTATPLDGGALLVGGALTTDPASSTDFVTSAEWVSLEGGSRPVDMGDDGPMRAEHGAQLVVDDDARYLYLFGGRVPGVAAATTVDVYRIDGTAGAYRLVRLTPDGGASGFAQLRSFVASPTGPLSAVAVGFDDETGVAVRLDWQRPGQPSIPFSFSTREGVPLLPARGDAAAVDLGDGLTLLLGGRMPSGAVLGSLAVYSAQANRSFRFPDTVQLQVPRYDATATILDRDRILITGGRPSSGSAIVAFESIRL